MKHTGKENRWLALLLILLLQTIGCTKQIQVAEEPIQPDISVEELTIRYQNELRAVPPLKGLMNITLDDTFYKRLWAKWYSDPNRIKVEGFDLFGGTLFSFQLKDDRLSLVTEKGLFSGSRAEFKQYLTTQSNQPIQIEWLKLFDWVARAGLPDLDLQHPPILENQGQFIYLSTDQEKIQIDRKTLKVTTVSLLNSAGAAEIIFGDYRSVEKTEFPFSITMNLQGKRMDITFKELKLDNRFNRLEKAK